MRYEKSCGAVVYSLVNNEPYYVLILSNEGIWGFPKGHSEGTESERETAIREIKEETGLDVTLTEGFRVSEKYEIYSRPRASKQVVYYLGSYENQSIKIQEEELQDAVLLPYDKALVLLKYPGKKKVLMQANAFLKGMNDGTDYQ